VTVGRPRIGRLDSGSEVAGGRIGRRPQAKGTVDMDPGPVGVSLGRCRRDVVEGACVHVAGLETNDHRTDRAAGEDARQVGDVNRPLGVGGHRLERTSAQPQETQGPVDGGVPFAVCDHPYVRATEETMLLDVPTGIGQHVVSGGSKRHCIGALRASHKAERCAGGQAQQLVEPTAGVCSERGRFVCALCASLLAGQWFTF